MEQDSQIRDIEPRKPIQLTDDRMKFVMIGAVIAGALLVFTLLVAIFAMKTGREAKRRAETLSEELTAATEGLYDMQERYNDLSKAYTDLEQRFNDLKTEYADLETRYEDLKKAYEELEAAYNETVEENNQLKTEAETEELEEQESEVQAFEDQFAGYYEPTSVMGMNMKMANIVYKIQGGKGDLEELYGLEIQRGGTGIFYDEGNPVNITWRLEEGKLILEREGFYSEAVYEGNTISLVVDDMDVVLTKSES